MFTKLEPFSQPMRRKTNTNGGLKLPAFPVFYYEFSSVSVVFLCYDWLAVVITLVSTLVDKCLLTVH